MLFDRVNSRMAEVKQRALGNAKTKYELTGILRSWCGKPMNGLQWRRTKYYRCQGAKRCVKGPSFKQCSCKCQRADVVENVVRRELWALLKDPARLRRLAKAKVDEEAAAKPQAGRDARKQLDAVKSEIERVIRMIREGLYDEDQGAREVAELRKQQAAHEAEVRALGKVAEIAPQSEVERICAQIAAGPQPQGEHWREVLDGFVDLTARLEGDEVIITGKLPLIAEGKENSGSNKWEHRLDGGQGGRTGVSRPSYVKPT
jgi:hypothetical protein